MKEDSKMTSIAIENMDHKAEIRQKTAKPLLWIGLVSIVMFFGGLTSAVVVSKADNVFGAYELPTMFLISTFVIVASSIFFHIGLMAIKKDNLSIAKFSFMITLALGLAFGYTQYLGWQQLRADGIFFSGGSAADSFLYVLTILHLAHVIGGIISLIVIVTKSVKKKYNANNNLGVQLGITYWHFLGGLWVYLFFFLKYIA